MARPTAVVLLTCLFVAAPAHVGAAQPTVPLVIDDFESEESLWNWGRWMGDAPAPMVLSGDHVSHGDRALKVTYPEAEAYGIHTFELPRDWSAYESLRFDIYYEVPAGDPSRWLGFNVYIDDFDSTGWATNFHQEGWRLRPGWNYKQIDIDSIARRRDSIDLTRVKALYFIMGNLPADTVVYFDHIRLEPRPPVASTGPGPLRLEAGSPSETSKTDRVTIICPGQFALDFDPNVGTITRWFDLAHDPERRTNLVAEYGRLLNNKFGFKSEDGEPLQGSAYLTPTEVPVLLEATPLRARVRMVCPGSRMYGGGALSAHVQGTTDYTVYPTGRVFVRNELRVVGETYRSKHFQLNMLTSWAAHNGSDGQAIRSSAKDFILHTHRGPGVTADALLAWHTGERPTSYFNAPYERVFYRSGVQLAQAMNQNLEPGTSLVWCFMLQLKPDEVDSEEAARPYALDYRNPATVTVARGVLVTNDPGDATADGFNEAEGCTVLAAREGTVVFSFSPGELTRYRPVFKVLKWAGPPPGTINAGGEVLRAGHDYLAHADAGTLLIQILRPVDSETEFVIAPE